MYVVLGSTRFSKLYSSLILKNVYQLMCSGVLVAISPFPRVPQDMWCNEKRPLHFHTQISEVMPVDRTQRDHNFIKENAMLHILKVL
jgi:hypothetical protein